ncbi:hypothetical protein BN2497_2171 [Janthinobacterium sp. CG23_2]|nr:hypothetical protein BN2497_2171 [Janthinobacterium sp. CG23_2]CUU27483.1 hypothetical protein BN3177_2171 [Janthinobacterium sp. CG23_2]
MRLAFLSSYFAIVSAMYSVFREPSIRNIMLSTSTRNLRRGWWGGWVVPPIGSRTWRAG